MSPALTRRTSRAGVGFVAPFLITFALVFVAPLLYSLYLSLFRTQLVGGTSLVGLANYAAVFVDLLTNGLEAHLSEAGDTFNGFVARHNLKFFGPVGPDIRDLLVETEVWLEQAESVSDLDLESLLSTWRSRLEAAERRERSVS